MGSMKRGWSLVVGMGGVVVVGGWCRLLFVGCVVLEPYGQCVLWQMLWWWQFRVAWEGMVGGGEGASSDLGGGSGREGRCVWVSYVGERCGVTEPSQGGVM